jgi:hypothetical protein
MFVLVKNFSKKYITQKKSHFIDFLRIKISNVSLRKFHNLIFLTWKIEPTTSQTNLKYI